MKRRFGLTSFILFVALCAVYSLVVAVPKVSADTAGDIRGATARWINRAKVEVTAGNQKFLFFDQDIDDPTYKYEIQSGCDSGNAGELFFFHNDSGTIRPSSGQIDLDIIPAGSVSNVCTDAGGFRAIDLSGSVGKADIIFARQSDTVIKRVDNNESWVFKQNDSYPELYMRTSEEGDECQDIIKVTGNNFVLYELTTDREGSAAPESLHSEGCYQEGGNSAAFPDGFENGRSYTLGTVNDTANPEGTSAPGDNGIGDEEGDQNITCETSGNPLTWFLCPIFNGVADAADWIFRNFIQRYLIVQPIRTTSDDPSFQVWSSFRVYGNILLVIVLLVIVFGQTIGGGVVDAYTVKKTAPKVFVGAILINLSIYVVNGMIDITNIIGAGLGEIMLAPLRASGQMTFSPDAGQGLMVLVVGFIGLLLGGATIGAVLSSTVFSASGGTFGAFAAKAGLFLLFSIFIPALLAIIAIFVTLMLRQGIILLLLLISPIAFALYCLPNTEKYFQKWWDLLFKALMAYPVIIAIFAVADLLSVATLNAAGMQANQGWADQARNGIFADPLAAMIAFVLQFLPLFLIPFSFKIAGGAIGALYGAVSGGANKANGMLQSRRDNEKKRLQRDLTASRVRAYRNLGTRAGLNQGTMRGRGYSFLQNRIGGEDMYAAAAAQQAAANKEQEDTTGAGIDDERRGLTVNKRAAMAHGALTTVDAEGYNTNGHVREKRDASGKLTGQRQFRTLGGKWIDENAVDQAHGRWDGDQYALQAATAYEMQKATTQEEQDYLFNNFGRLRESGSGFSMSGGELGGLWTGAGFAKQNSDRQWKHYSWDEGNNRLQLGSLEAMREIDERQGNWAMTAQHADTWTTLSEATNRSRQALADHAAPGGAKLTADDEAYHKDVLQRGARIARSLGGPIMDEHGNPVPGTSGGIGQGASGRTKEEMENFASLYADSDYVREYGTQRRGDHDARPGDTPDFLVPVSNKPAAPYTPPRRPTKK